MSILVSFLCPTYGRCAKQPKVLAEAVYWFLRQDYRNKELLVLNDAPGQTLVIDAPGVRIINWPKRFSSLGAKMNRLVAEAVGEVCLPCEDDDVSLPWRARQAIEMLRRYDYWSPKRYWYHQLDRGRLEFDGSGVGHNCSAFRRAALLNRYADTSHGHDAEADGLAYQQLRCNKTVLENPRDVSYVYRWGVSNFHLSAQGEMNGAYEKYDAGPPGEYRVEPAMGFDYLAMRAAALA